MENATTNKGKAFISFHPHFHVPVTKYIKINLTDTRKGKSSVKAL